MNNTLYLPVSVEDKNHQTPTDKDFIVFYDNGEMRRHYEDDMPFAIATHWLKPLSLEEVRDYLAGVQRNDLAGVVLPSVAEVRNIMVCRWGMKGSYSYEAAKAILERVKRDLLASKSNTDEAVVASHTCTVGNYIEQKSNCLSCGYPIAGDMIYCSECLCENDDYLNS